MNVTRRQLLVAFAAFAAGALLGFPSHAAPKKRRRKIYRLSSRGRRASPAVKAYNANLRFRTKRAAKKNRAHPGDTSEVVPLTVSAAEFRRLFGRRGKIADLRTL
jgi:hypothetical protein